MGCKFTMSDTRLEDFFGAAGGARIEKMRAFPEKAADSSTVCLQASASASGNIFPSPSSKKIASRKSPRTIT